MEGIRQVLCVMTLLAYNLIVCYVLSHQEGDLDFCDEVLNAQLMVIIIVCSFRQFRLESLESDWFVVWARYFSRIQMVCGFCSSKDALSS